MSAVRARALVVVASVALALGGAARTARAVSVDLPFGAEPTRVAVKLDERLSSQDNKVGDVFTFELTGSAMVDGLALAAGTRGHGVVVAVASGEGPKHGFLTLAAQSIDPAGASPIPVALAPGSLDRTLSRELRGFSLPVGRAVPLYVGSSRDNNVVYEKGTAFTVVAPPPPTPEPAASP